MLPVKPRRNIDCLDAFRGLAILFVFVYHYAIEAHGIRQHSNTWDGHWRTFSLTQNWIVNVFCYPLTLGWAGVSLFFVISGFVIHYAFETVSGHTWGGYFRRRFWRIYPPYLLALLVFSVSGPLVYRGSLEFDWQQFVVHALLIHNFTPWSFEAVNCVFWSLAVECQFYLLYPVVRVGFRYLGAGRTLLLAGLLSLSIRVALWCTRGPVQFDPWWNSTLVLWFDWILGAYLARKYLLGQRVFRRPATSIVLAGAAFLGSTLYRPTAGLSFSLASVFAAAVLDARLHASPPALWLWIERRLAPVGLISYSLYLYHLPLFDYIFSFWRTAPLGFRPTGLFALLALPVIFLLIAGLSYLLYRFVEVPCIRIGRGGKVARAPAPPLEESRVEVSHSGSIG